MRLVSFVLGSIFAAFIGAIALYGFEKAYIFARYTYWIDIKVEKVVDAIYERVIYLRKNEGYDGNSLGEYLYDFGGEFSSTAGHPRLPVASVGIACKDLKKSAKSLADYAEGTFDLTVIAFAQEKIDDAYRRSGCYSFYRSPKVQRP